MAVAVLELCLFLSPQDEGSLSPPPDQEQAEPSDAAVAQVCGAPCPRLTAYFPVPLQCLYDPLWLRVTRPHGLSSEGAPRCMWCLVIINC